MSVFHQCSSNDHSIGLSTSASAKLPAVLIFTTGPCVVKERSSHAQTIKVLGKHYQ